MLRFTLIPIVCLCGLRLFGQQDFNNFKTLSSQGPIPADFSTLTSSKVESDLAENKTGLKGEKERIFLEGIHYSIDEILQSNVVIYGDEISLYVAEVAAKLLKDQPEIQRSLRFYTLKSNQANALSTDQGIIFVTTGLISQLTSEAQLAYVLAHEISHFTEHHVVETFEYKTDRKNLYIDKLSVYSKEKEFEADKLAISLYSKAGYSKAEIEGTFDVLMYSYLPFDEVPFPHDYYNTSRMYVPETIFPDKKYEIKAEEDVDDSKSSHPNIRKRKDAARETVNSTQNWEENVYFSGEEKFQYIRNLARFESVRSDIIDASFTQALYSIFLLEREFPESVYLKRMKAQSWLGIAQFKTENTSSLNDTKPDEGEIATFHKMLKNLGAVTSTVMALRVNYDLSKQMPEDAELTAIYDRTVKTCAINKKFKLEDFSAKTFAEASALVLVKDTLVAPQETGSSKYDKIKKKKSPDSPDSFDTLRFAYYGVGDIINDAAFLQKFKSFQAEGEKAEQEKEALSKLSRSERKKATKLAEKNEMRLGLKNLIVVEPSVIEYSHKKIDHKRSEELGGKLGEAIVDVAGMLDVPVESLSSQTLADNGTQDFNDRSVLYSSVEQSLNFRNVDFFPVDFQLLSEIEKRREKSTALFIVAEHRYQPEIQWLYIGYSVLLLPVLPFTVAAYVVPQLIAGHQSEFSFLILDLKKGQVTTGMSVLFHEQLTRHNMGAHFYTSLKQLTSTPQ